MERRLEDFPLLVANMGPKSREEKQRLLNSMGDPEQLELRLMQRVLTDELANYPFLQRLFTTLSAGEQMAFKMQAQNVAKLRAMLRTVESDAKVTLLQQISALPRDLFRTFALVLPLEVMKELQASHPVLYALFFRYEVWKFRVWQDFPNATSLHEMTPQLQWYIDLRSRNVTDPPGSRDWMTDGPLRILDDGSSEGFRTLQGPRRRSYTYWKRLYELLQRYPPRRFLPNLLGTSAVDTQRIRAEKKPPGWLWFDTKVKNGVFTALVKYQARPLTPQTKNDADSSLLLLQIPATMLLTKESPTYETYTMLRSRIMRSPVLMEEKFWSAQLGSALRCFFVRVRTEDYGATGYIMTIDGSAKFQADNVLALTMIGSTIYTIQRQGAIAEFWQHNVDSKTSKLAKTAAIRLRNLKKAAQPNDVIMSPKNADVWVTFYVEYRSPDYYSWTYIYTIARYDKEGNRLAKAEYRGNTQFPSDAHKIHLSPSEKLLVLTTRGLLRIYDTQTLKMLKDCDVQPTLNYAEHLEFSPCERYFSIWATNQTAMYSVKTGKRVQNFSGSLFKFAHSETMFFDHILVQHGQPVPIVQPIGYANVNDEGLMLVSSKCIQCEQRDATIKKRTEPHLQFCGLECFNDWQSV